MYGRKLYPGVTELRSFQSEIRRPPGVGTWHYIDIPFDIVAEFGSKGQIRVRGTLNGVPFRSTLLPNGASGHYLVVGKDLREQAQVDRGDTVTVSLELDDAPRAVELHPDLAAALAANPPAKQRFDRMPYSYQKRVNDHIVEAKKAETRARRIEKTLRELL